jgi:hypothetical protein
MLFLEDGKLETPKLDVIKAEPLHPSIKAYIATKLFEVVKCLEDLQPFAKEAKEAITNLKDISSILKLKDVIMGIYHNADNITNDCLYKFKELVDNYFNK